MRRLSEYLFYIWLLSLPFSRFNLVGTLSFDQILGPALVVLWLVAKPAVDDGYVRGHRGNVVVGATLLMFYFLSHALTFVLSQTAIWSYTYRFLTDLPAFLLPILYIRSNLMQRRAEDCIVLVALLGASTSFLVAYGILDLSFARQSADRLAIEGLELTRATGLIGAFGDMAILSAFSLMIVLSFQRNIVLFVRRSWMTSLGIPFVLFLGFLGSQSRNIAITVIVSVVLFLLIGMWTKRGTAWIPRFYIFLTLAAATAAITLGFFFDPLFDLISSLGGKSASGTAHARLEQYAFGLELLDGRYLSGVAPEVAERYDWYIYSVHNMWIKEFVIGGMLAVMATFAFLLVGLVKMTRCLRIDPLDYAARLRLVLCITLFISTQFNPSGTSVFWVMVSLILATTCTAEPLPATRRAPVRPAIRVARG